MRVTTTPDSGQAVTENIPLNLLLFVNIPSDFKNCTHTFLCSLMCAEYYLHNSSVYRIQQNKCLPPFLPED
jgi:hypothetical protein